VNARAHRLALGPIVGVTIWLLVPPERPPGPARATSLGQRLIGPVASLVASAQWVRFDAALLAGEAQRAYAIAQRAIELDPGAWQGWFTLGSHLIYDRGAELREAEPSRQRAWIRAGLDVLEEGARRSREPAELDLVRGGSLTQMVALRAERLAWPGGALAAIEEGIEALERARERGHPHAEVQLELARQTRDALRAGQRPPSWPTD
jgi:hypothetical protein